MGALIELEGVTKSFTVRERAGRVRRHKRTVQAVAGIDLAVEAGAAVGYIGPNGECRIVLLSPGLQPAPHGNMGSYHETFGRRERGR